MTNILITAPPRSGKTTLINELLSTLSKYCIGMITNEIRQGGVRKGFQIESLSGSTFILASKKNFSSRYRVSNYGVYVENLGKIVKILEKEIEEKEPEIIIIDEIGKMELCSSSFKIFLEKCLDTKKVLGTIMLRDTEYSKKIKERKDTEVFLLTKDNREMIKNKIIMRLN
ncbi:AAA family ATPase [Candidatus Heimdallarchaeota archaeon]|nr:MAG: AAA family ATPase [Candidatus Heimdallarchaeota archaeon]